MRRYKRFLADVLEPLLWRWFDPITAMAADSLRDLLERPTQHAVLVAVVQQTEHVDFIGSVEFLVRPSAGNRGLRKSRWSKPHRLIQRSRHDGRFNDGGS